MASRMATAAFHFKLRSLAVFDALCESSEGGAPTRLGIVSEGEVMTDPVCPSVSNTSSSLEDSSSVLARTFSAERMMRCNRLAGKCSKRSLAVAVSPSWCFARVPGGISLAKASKDVSLKAPFCRAACKLSAAGSKGAS